MVKAPLPNCLGSNPSINTQERFDAGSGGKASVSMFRTWVSNSTYLIGLLKELCTLITAKST